MRKIKICRKNKGGAKLTSLLKRSKDVPKSIFSVFGLARLSSGRKDNFTIGFCVWFGYFVSVLALSVSLLVVSLSLFVSLLAVFASVLYVQGVHIRLPTCALWQHIWTKLLEGGKRFLTMCWWRYRKEGLRWIDRHRHRDRISLTDDITET